MIDVSRETADLLNRYADLLVQENSRQNLIAASTIEALQQRHIEDALQLLRFAPAARHWLDIGSGPGLPGLVLAIAKPQARLTLVEPRALRVQFLRHAIETLSLRNVTVHQSKIGSLAPLNADAITARAVASLTALLTMSHDHAAASCVWVLPKGRSAAEELAEARRTWHGEFSLQPSITDPEAAIVVARNVQPRKPARRAR